MFVGFKLGFLLSEPRFLRITTTLKGPVGTSISWGHIFFQSGKVTQLANDRRRTSSEYFFWLVLSKLHSTFPDEHFERIYFLNEKCIARSQCWQITGAKSLCTEEMILLSQYMKTIILPVTSLES